MLQYLCYTLCILHLARGNLMRINEWSSIPLATDQKMSLDISLFLSCEKFSIVFSSLFESSWFKFEFDDEVLRKIDVTSEHLEEVPKPPRLVGSCREVDRKELAINITAKLDFFEFQIGDQRIRRPRPRNSQAVMIAIPQKAACCVIKSRLNHQDKNFLLEFLTTSTSPTTLATESTVGKVVGVDVFARSDVVSPTKDYQSGLITMPTFETPVTVDDRKYKSWTDYVNREWSTYFLVFSWVTGVFMALLIFCSFALFLCLQTVPKNAMPLFAVEEPDFY